MWCWRPKCTTKWGRSPTIAEPRGATSWTASEPAWNGWGWSTSTSTRFTASTRSPRGGDLASDGGPGAPRFGALLRHLQLAGLADHEGNWNFGASRVVASRFGAGVLFACEPRSGAGSHSALGRSTRWVDGLEPARWRS